MSDLPDDLRSESARRDLYPLNVTELRDLIVAARAIHSPCHTAVTRPYGCSWGHGSLTDGAPSLDEPAVCVCCCTYNDRTVTYPCPTSVALGVTR